MICRHFGCTGKCRLFSRCKEDSLIYDKEGHCVTKGYDKCYIDSLNCDEEGYCLTAHDDTHPEDSCDNYEK
jgi:hypothetical protein